MAWKLLKHAFTMVFGNLSQALKVTIAPMILITAVGYFVGSLEAMPLGSEPTLADMQTQLASLLGRVVIALPVLLFAFAWMAVAWHRFILLEEYPGAIPALRGGLILSYILKSIGIGLIFVVVFFVLSFVLGFALLALGNFGAIILGLLVMVLLGLLWFRVALILPASSVNKPLTLGDSWKVTADSTGSLINLVIIMAVFQTVVGMITQQVYLFVPIIGTVLNMAVQWVIVIVGLSLLTTLYGHLVEGRDLSE